MEFREFSKIPRLTREVVITEKIDGTNAQILLWPTHNSYNGEYLPYILHQYEPHNDLGDRLVLMAGSRNRWLKPGEDNYGFCSWVKAHRNELILLGEGRHYGEWWGKGIQRGYNIPDKRFSLFNTSRWNSDWNTKFNGETRCLEVPSCHVVPILGRDAEFDTSFANSVLQSLEDSGSVAAPGFMNPEGIIVYHIAGNIFFKKTIKNDESPKSQIKGVIS